MKTKNDKKNLPESKESEKKTDNPEGYPPYPSDEDMYNRFHKEENSDPEDPTKIIKIPENETIGMKNEKDFEEDETGSDLDVPGSELDDNQEDVGSEDEENNYYSLGGDDHNDLDEDKGD